MKGTNQFIKNYLILAVSKLRKKIGQKDLGHPAIAWIQADTRCQTPEKKNSFQQSPD